MIRSPRWLRPDTIQIVNVLPEYEWEQESSTVVVKHVKVDLSANASMGTTGRTIQDTMKVVIDLHDYSAAKQYVKPEDLQDPEFQFTVRIGDRIEYEGREWEVTGTEEILALRTGPEFLEVTAE